MLWVTSFSQILWLFMRLSPITSIHNMLEVKQDGKGGCLGVCGVRNRSINGVERCRN
jgi:hypothetical protein